MKLLTKNTDYAIRALFVLAEESDGFISARDIARRQNIPYQFLRKILQQLIKEGLVISKEGGRGGVKLEVPPDKIKVSDIMSIFQGGFEVSECMFRKRLCANHLTCVLRTEIARIKDLVNREFRGITIAGLMGRVSGKGEKNEKKNN